MGGWVALWRLYQAQPLAADDQGPLQFRNVNEPNVWREADDRLLASVYRWSDMMLRNPRIHVDEERSLVCIHIHVQHLYTHLEPIRKIRLYSTVGFII